MTTAKRSCVSAHPPGRWCSQVGERRVVTGPIWGKAAPSDPSLVGPTGRAMWNGADGVIESLRETGRKTRLRTSGRMFSGESSQVVSVEVGVIRG